MKHFIPIQSFTFNKIFEGIKKVDIRLFDKTTQRIRLHDSIVYGDPSNGNQIECLVKGIALFENFEELITHIPCNLIGYTNPEEISIRIKRLYPDKFRLSFFACALFIDKINEKYNEKDGNFQNDYVEENQQQDEERVHMKKSERPQPRMTFDEERLLYGMHNYQHD